MTYYSKIIMISEHCTVDVERIHCAILIILISIKSELIQVIDAHKFGTRVGILPAKSIGRSSLPQTVL